MDILQDTSSQYPGTVAIQGADDEITYEDLEELVDIQAQRLWDRGIGRGDRVGIRVPSGTTDLYVAILSTLAAGAAYVPVDFDETDSRADTVWNEAQVAAVYGEDLRLSAGPAAPNGDPSPPSLDDDAWIIFTSGSTGTPKGVAVTHRSAAALVDAEARMYLIRRPLGPEDRVMAGLSVAFDASCEEMWLAWRHGSTLVAASREVVRSGEDLGRWIVDEQITAVSTVPTLASLWPVESLRAVRLLIFGGEACPLSLVERLAHPGREVWNTYGPTEATVIASGQLLSAQPPVRIGRPVPGWRLAVVDPEGVPVRWGQTGELVIGGVGLGRYLDPAKDAVKYAPLPALGWDRAYRTGDLVVADREGLLFGGRADDQVKIGGRRLELGEVDDHLSAMPGVSTGAAAVHSTRAGTDVLVGYLVPREGVELDMEQIRGLLSQRMPDGITPVLTVLDAMPLKTSGKVDRAALPWPLVTGESTPQEGLPEQLAWLGELWAEQLGPVPLAPESDFFSLGGGSVAVARLVAALRTTHPAAEIRQLFVHSTLAGMAEYLAGLDHEDEPRPMPPPLPRSTGAVQFAVMAALTVANGLRYVLGSLIVVWVLGSVVDAGWVPEVPLLPLVLGWLVVFSLPGRVLITAGLVRILNTGLRPGAYPRGGAVHLRIWTADRLVVHQRIDQILGTPLAPAVHRLFGNRVGRDCHLHHLPPVSGLVEIGDAVTVEHEADLNGHWIDGGTFHLGAITVGAGARIGTRTLVAGDTSVGPGAEVLPGSHVDRPVPAGELWGGSPLVSWGSAGLSWPEDRHRGTVTTWGPQLNRWAHVGGLALISLLPLLAVLPAALLILTQVRHVERYEVVFPILALWTPVFTVLTAATWLALVIFCVRLVAPMIAPGYFAQNGPVGWAVWFTHALLQRTLVSTYPVYASIVTPTFLRLLGARVGRGTEISTVETIPHLTVIEDGAFLADHALATGTRGRCGWLHVGTTLIGERSFVGNSAIVGPDRDVPGYTLVAVLSSAPHQPRRGSSWLGRRAAPVPRVKQRADASRTFDPPLSLRLARAGVEACRILPAMIAAWLDLTIVYVLTRVYMAAGSPAQGLWQAVLWSGPVVAAAAVVAALLPVLIKWAVIGPFRSGERPLHSSFVWRGELVDVFVESLAVPALVRMALGSPLLSVWARLMGARIGRNVWCETWWLPEYDLIQIQDRATVNRGTVVQTHLFHDRVMTMETVTLAAGSTLGPNSFVLPGARLGERSTVLGGSLVMRQDALPADSVWGGNPVGHMVRDEQETASAVQVRPARTVRSRA